MKIFCLLILSLIFCDIVCISEEEGFCKSAFENVCKRKQNTAKETENKCSEGYSSWSKYSKNKLILFINPENHFELEIEPIDLKSMQWILVNIHVAQYLFPYNTTHRRHLDMSIHRSETVCKYRQDLNNKLPIISLGHFYHCTGMCSLQISPPETAGEVVD